MKGDESVSDSNRAKLDAACAKATELKLAGHSGHAGQLYRAILQADPKHAAANHGLGVIELQAQRAQAALPLLVAALEMKPGEPSYWLGVLEALLQLGRLDEAASTLELATQHGLAGAAVDDFARRLKSLRAPAARAQRRSETRLRQKQEKSLLSLISRHQFAAAAKLAQGMTEHFPDSGLAFKVLGAFKSADGRHQDAMSILETAVRLLPTDAEAHVNLALNLVKLERLDEAEAWLGRAIEIDPTRASPHFRLAMIHGLRNRYAEAEAALKRGFELDANHTAGEGELSYSGFLFIVSHDATVDADELFARHRRVGEIFTSKVRDKRPVHANVRDPRRRLKVGFVSGDFFFHAVSMFIEPVLEHLSKSNDLELHAYYNNTVEDAVTERLKSQFKTWRSIAGMDDATATKRIAADGIDILIDLSGHSALNRMPLFARKPAPVQVSWIGYPGTTGLSTMDYYLADRYFLPPGQFDRHFTEKIVHLPANAPFRSPETTIAINTLPALSRGAFCFASFNRLGKVTARAMDLWSELLRQVPTARMLVGAVDLDSQERSFAEQFGERGIPAERLEFHRRSTMDTYLALHHQVDICLDAYPYTGGTTTIQALWMGVPTLTLAGPTPASRQGAAIMGQLGLDQFIARDPQDFCAKGLYWATHLEALAAIRAGLRDRWQASPARQADVIAEGLEQALRRMWTRWCDGLGPESF